jgi:diguanylate cyclase (GGDEF)-like protein
MTALSPSRSIFRDTEVAKLTPLAQWHLLESAFGTVRAEPAAAMVPAIGAIATYVVLGQPWCLVWAAATLAGIGIARSTAAWFKTRVPDDSAAVWARRYTAALWCQAALVGAGGAGVALRGDGACCLLVALPVGFTLLRQAASASMAGAARGEIMVLAGPLCIGCLVVGSKLAIVTGGLFAMQAAAALALAGNAVARAQKAACRDAHQSDVPEASQTTLAPSVASFQRLLGRDQLTGLPNRHSFMHVLAQETARAVRAETTLSVLLVAWDGYDAFETANQQDVVDATLARIARRLRTMLRRRGDIIANLGGGRFAIVLASTDAFGATTVSRNLQNALRTPDPRDDASDDLRNITLSIGAATYCGKGALPDGQLFQFAEEALVNARRHGGSTIQRYDAMTATWHAAKAPTPAPNPAVKRAPVLAEGSDGGSATTVGMERPATGLAPPG